MLGGNPLLTEDLWRRMYDAVPRRGGEGIVRMCMAGIDFALWDLKGKLVNVPVSALFGSQRPRVNPLLEFQVRLFKEPLLREEATAEGIVLVPPDGPGLGLELDDAVAAASLVPE